MSDIRTTLDLRATAKLIAFHSGMTKAQHRDLAEAAQVDYPIKIKTGKVLEQRGLVGRVVKGKDVLFSATDLGREVYLAKIEASM